MTTAVAIALVAHRGAYLVGRRGANSPLAGFAEFPGGKCAPGEAPADCAVRECREETGLDVEVLRLRREVEHTYPYGRMRLYFFDCRVIGASAPPCPLANFTWVPRERLMEYRFPEPNVALLAELARESPSPSTGT